MILKGVTIGKNCFIGVGGIVTKDILVNSIVVGVPCKVVMSLEDYYRKRKEKYVPKVLNDVRSIKECLGREPLTIDFWEEFPLFVDGDKITEYPGFAVSYDDYVEHHKVKYEGVDAFLKVVGLKE